MDVINVALLIVILINLMLVVVSSSCPKDSSEITPIYISYLFNITTITWWVASMILYRVGSIDDLDLIVRLLYVSAACIASSFYYFSLVFPQKEKSFRKDLYIVSVLNIILTYLIFGTNLIVEKTLENRNVILGDLYWIYVVYIISFFGISFWRMFVRYIKTSKKVEKLQSLSVFVGYVLSGLIAVTTNLFFPWFNIPEYQYLGPLSTVCVALSISYAVKKYHLFNLQIVATETFVLLLWTCTVLRVCLVDEIAPLSINLSFILLVIVVVILSIRSVKKEHFQFEKNIVLLKELETANLKLSELDNQKTKFVNLAAHHIASPVTSIKAYLSLLRGECNSVFNTEDLKTVESIMENLVHILRDFLDISRIEMTGITLQKTRANIMDVMNNTIQKYETTLRNKNIEIQKEYQSEDIEAFCDIKEITSVFGNILENSISYSKDSSILIKIEKDESFVFVCIEDKGVRNIPHVSESLLSKFSESKNQKEADIIGRGLGLYVAKKIIELHSGSLSVEGGDKTTIFNVRLPIDA